MSSIDSKLKNPDNETSMSPYKCKCDNDIFIVKFAENIQGPRGLINEYVAYEIAKLLDLPIPECKFVRIPDYNEFVITVHGNEKKILSKIAFGSKFIEKAVAIYSERFFVDCQNKDNLFLIILFDHLIHNVDRNQNLANTLYQSHTKLIYIIDHERIFGAGNIWDKYSCNRGANEKFQIESFQGDGLYGKINRNVNLRNQISNAVNKVKSITYDDLSYIISNIPSEWRCSNEDKVALLNYLSIRLSRVDELVDLLLEAI